MSFLFGCHFTTEHDAIDQYTANRIKGKNIQLSKSHQPDHSQSCQALSTSTSTSTSSIEVKSSAPRSSLSKLESFPLLADYFPDQPDTIANNTISVTSINSIVSMDVCNDVEILSTTSIKDHIFSPINNNVAPYEEEVIEIIKQPKSILFSSSSLSSSSLLSPPLSLNKVTLGSTNQVSKEDVNLFPDRSSSYSPNPGPITTSASTSNREISKINKKKKHLKIDKLFVYLQLVADDRLAVECKPPSKIVDSIVKNIDSSLFDDQLLLWTAPLSSHNSLCARIIALDSELLQVNLSKIDEKYMLNQKLDNNGCNITSSSNNLSLKFSSMSGIPCRLAKSLYPFQREGVEFAVQHKGRVIIGDEMGLGKSIQSLAIASYYRESWPVLIVCPSSLRLNWKNEILRWLPECKSKQIQVVLSGKDRILIEKKKTFASHTSNSSVKNSYHYSSMSVLFVIISYDLVSKFQPLLSKKNIELIIADESHYIKSSDAKRTESLVPLLQKSKYCILLTGTAAINRPIELYTQINCIRPGFFGSLHDFGLKYCDGRKGRFGMEYKGATRLGELHFLLKKEIMIRRMKNEVLHDLKPKTRQVIIIPTQNDQLKRQVQQLLTDQPNLLSSVIDKNQSGHLKSDTRATLFSLYELTGQSKLSGCINYILGLLAGGAKCLVFAHHLRVLDGIETALKQKNIEYFRLDGSTKAEDRSFGVNKFQTDESCRVALLSITAGGIGLTLTASSTVVFAELYWTPSQLCQAEDRVHRIGQPNAVNVHYLIGTDTLDEYMWSILVKKFSVVSKTLNAEDSKLEIEQVSGEAGQLQFYKASSRELELREEKRQLRKQVEMNESNRSKEETKLLWSQAQIIEDSDHQQEQEQVQKQSNSKNNKSYTSLFSSPSSSSLSLMTSHMKSVSAASERVRQSKETHVKQVKGNEKEKESMYSLLKESNNDNIKSGNDGYNERFLIARVGLKKNKISFPDQNGEEENLDEFEEDGWIVHDEIGEDDFGISKISDNDDNDYEGAEGKMNEEEEEEEQEQEQEEFDIRSSMNSSPSHQKKIQTKSNMGDTDNRINTNGNHYNNDIDDNNNKINCNVKNSVDVDEGNDEEIEWMPQVCSDQFNKNKSLSISQVGGNNINFYCIDKDDNDEDGDDENHYSNLINTDERYSEGEFAVAKGRSRSLSRRRFIIMSDNEDEDEISKSKDEEVKNIYDSSSIDTGEVKSSDNVADDVSSLPPLKRLKKLPGKSLRLKSEPQSLSILTISRANIYEKMFEDFDLNNNISNERAQEKVEVPSPIHSSDIAFPPCTTLTSLPVPLRLPLLTESSLITTLNRMEYKSNLVRKVVRELKNEGKSKLGFCLDHALNKIDMIDKNRNSRNLIGPYETSNNGNNSAQVELQVDNKSETGSITEELIKCHSCSQMITIRKYKAHAIECQSITKLNMAVDERMINKVDNDADKDMHDVEEEYEDGIIVIDEVVID